MNASWPSCYRLTLGVVRREWTSLPGRAAIAMIGEGGPALFPIGADAPKHLCWLWLDDREAVLAFVRPLAWAACRYRGRQCRGVERGARGTRRHPDRCCRASFALLFCPAMDRGVARTSRLKSLRAGYSHCVAVLLVSLMPTQAISRITCNEDCAPAAAGVRPGVAVPAYGQVIEIDSAGVAQTFDGPTQFTATEAVAIVAGKRRSAACATPPPRLARTLGYGLDPACCGPLRGRNLAADEPVSHKGALGSCN